MSNIIYLLFAFLFFFGCNLSRVRSMDISVKNIKILNPDEKFDDRHPVFSTDGSKIVFESDRGGNIDIWIMNSDGTQMRQLTFDNGVDEYPSFSPDNKEVVFSSEKGGKYPDIWMIGVNGENLRQLTRLSSANYAPNFSPDGKHIAFISYRTDELSVWVMDREGNNQRQVTEGGTGDWGPVWSPDSKTIAFASRRHGKYEVDLIRHPSFHVNSGDVWLVNSEGEEKNYRQLTLDKERDMLPVYSPDGKKIAFYSERKGKPDIWIMNADGSSQSQLTEGISGKWKPRYDFRFDFYKGMAYFYLNWSPDGRKIAYTKVGKSGKGDIGIINLDLPISQTSNIVSINKEVTENNIDFAPGFSSDKNLVMDDSGNIFVVYEYFDGRGSRIMFNQYHPGSGWGKPQNIDQRTGNAYYPQIALADNIPVIVFVQEQSEEWAVLARRLYPTGRWSDIEKIDSKIKFYPATEKIDERASFVPQIAANSSGRIFVAYRKWDDKKFRVAVNTFEPKNGWGKSIYLDAGKGGTKYPPAVAVDDKGWAVVAFTEQEEKNNYYRIYAMEYNPFFGWKKPMIIDQGDGAGFASNLAFNDRGEVVTVFEQELDSRNRVYAGRYLLQR